MEMILSKDDQLTVWEFAVKLSKSKMIPSIFIGKPEDVFVTMLYGKELGLNPLIALNSICVVQGQVTLKVQTMTAIVLNRHPKAIIDIKQDETKKEVVVTVKRHPEDVAYTSTWNMEKAKAMGLAGKTNYITQPLTMLRARALSEAYRVKFADSLLGFLSNEEMQDIEVAPEKSLIQIMNESAEIDNPIPEEEKAVGPLYRFQNSKFRGKQFYELSVDVLEEFADDLVKRKSKKPWEVALESTIRSYLVNYESGIYTEQLAELRAEHEAVEP